ncbi:DUF3857 domain-containing transglutaminase family protein [bacterium]|nr:DUF3857 domain-containing transglutaminase family protein [bacterium]PJA76701.1 MAG: hypothetical protein CO151_01965 [bacterium CG_4_9_14_3_um_filter_65_15]
MRQVLNIFVLLSVLVWAVAAQSAPDLPPGDKPAPTPLSRIADVGTADDRDGADMVVVLDKAVNKVKPSGVTDVSHYRLLKVLTEAGCRDQSVLNWHYDPQSSHVEVRKVTIIRDGEYLPVDVGPLHDLPAPQSAIYWNDRVKTLQLPRLRVGDGIEIITTRKGFTYALLDAKQGGTKSCGGGQPAYQDTEEEDARYIPPMPGEYFDIVIFPENDPVLEKRYELQLPPNKKLQSQIYNGALFASTSFDDDRNTYTWWALDLPARTHEPHQPDAGDFAAKVVMTTVGSWEAKSRWFFDVNRDQFQVTPEIKAKVQEILAAGGLENASDEAKARALVHWVAQNIRYSGQTMGEGEGFTLHPGNMIFEQRSGVCKDIAGMLITMMRGAGLDSYAAMTMAGSRIDQVPADQFNHCVTALRLPDGSFRMYDPTWVPYNNDIWSRLETEQQFLVGSPEGTDLNTIAFSSAAESPLKAVHQAGLDGDGTLSGTLRLDGTGAMDSRLRRLVNGSRRAELADRCARLLSAASDRVVIDKVTNRDPADFTGDMWLEITYHMPGFAAPSSGALNFASPLGQVMLHEPNLLGTANETWDKDRETDMLLWYTRQIDGNETIKLPRGFALDDEADAVDVDETYAGFTGEAGLDGRTLTVTSRCEVRRRQIPPDGYPGFREAMTSAKEFCNRVYRLSKEGK